MVVAMATVVLLIIACDTYVQHFWYDCDEAMARSASGRMSDSEWDKYREKCPH